MTARDNIREVWESRVMVLKCDAAVHTPKKYVARLKETGSHIVVKIFLR